MRAVRTASNNRLERSRGRVFDEPWRESMIGIKCLRLTLAKPRVAQLRIPAIVNALST
jgi:hypothetical protein